MPSPGNDDGHCSDRIASPIPGGQTFQEAMNAYEAGQQTFEETFSALTHALRSDHDDMQRRIVALEHRLIGLGKRIRLVGVRMKDDLRRFAQLDEEVAACTAN
jgi:hypothetical protein